MGTAFRCRLWGLAFSLSHYIFHSAASTSPSVYIVYLGLIKHNDPLLTSEYHLQLLSNLFASKEEAKQSLLYSYKHSFSGFSAKLNSTQATNLKEIEGVISVFKSKTMRLHTTRSWDFMGLTILSPPPYELTRRSSGQPQHLTHYGDYDVIVGIFDTGIWPESHSFKEEDCMLPVPRRWKGKCEDGEKFEARESCNKKVIGARYYVKGFEEEYGQLRCKSEYRSIRDYLGHGTHTASTAVGSIVENASFVGGFGQGTARGGNPRARLAVYKVCWSYELDAICTETDILAAFDVALHDGVDVISASFGHSPPLNPFFASHADIGSFHAMQRGVTVVFSAGNDGPTPASVQNVSPWSICVAASSIDRTFPTRIVLNDDVNNFFMGESLNSKQITAKLAPARRYFDDGDCKREKLKKNKTAAGKVIICFWNIGGAVTSGDAAVAAWTANATGLIFVQPPTFQSADIDFIPTVHVDIFQGTKIAQYLAQSMRLPTIQISAGTTVINKSPAPTVAYFSSRGPSSITSDILKPDISAPGMNILAAWPPDTSPTLFPQGDGRSVEWNFQSGTSMSCPHVSGVVSLIKSFHRDWSPAAIKSALMTTAYNTDTPHDTILAGGSSKVSDAFDIGAGHINPLKAMDPGLVYDMKTNDYILYLCSIGYTEDQIRIITTSSKATSPLCPKSTSSPDNYNKNMISNINYPAIMISNLESTITIKRNVRNVGIKKTAIYFVVVNPPNGVHVSVWPRILFFSCFKEEVTYYVTLTPKKKSQGRYDFGEIIWSDGFHFVRSPLVVCVNTITTSSEQLFLH